MIERKWKNERKRSKNFMCHWEFLFLGDDMEVADDGVKPSNELFTYHFRTNNDSTILKAASLSSCLRTKAHTSITPNKGQS